MKNKIASLKAIFVILFLRLLLSLPDSFLAKLTGWIRFPLSKMGAPSELLANIDDVRTIFSEGGERTQIVRRMIREGHPRRRRMIFRGFFLR